VELMICPTCKDNLQETAVEGINLDVCKNGCGGIWFDRFELKKMDEPHEFTDENLVDMLAADSQVDPDKSSKHKCPKCQDVVMMRHFFTVKKEVEVDVCPKCGGYWLDEGELFHIRKQFNTEEERSQAAIEYFSGMFDGDLAKMRAEGKEKAEKAKKIANMFRLITPSYYFPKLKNW